MLAAMLLALTLPAGAADYSLRWNATFAPPHNEPVVGDRVARYRLHIEPGIEFKFLRYRLAINAWGVNHWRTSDTVGHGFPEAWEGSDWSVEEWRTSTTHRLELGPGWLHFFTEYYLPLDRKSWGGHGMETNYYWLTGVGGAWP